MSLFGVQLNVQIRLSLRKDKYMPNIRTLYQSFVQYDPLLTGLIVGSNFQKALNSNGIFVREYDIQVLQKAYNQSRRISWFRFLQLLKQPLSPERRELVQNIFDRLDADKKGKLSASNLMSHFNPNLIETYRYGNKNLLQMAQQFLSMLYIQEGCITRQQFVNFYDDLNINFSHNDIFFRYVSAQWFYTPGKIEQAMQEQVRKHVLALRNKLLEKTQGSKEQLLINKMFRTYDIHGKLHLGPQDLGLMFQKLKLNVQPRLIEPILVKLDKNQSGYIQLEQFKKFLYHNPYSH